MWESFHIFLVVNQAFSRRFSLTLHPGLGYLGDRNKCVIMYPKRLLICMSNEMFPCFKRKINCTSRKQGCEFKSSLKCTVTQTKCIMSQVPFKIQICLHRLLEDLHGRSCKVLKNIYVFLSPWESKVIISFSGKVTGNENTGLSPPPPKIPCVKSYEELYLLI